MSSKISRRPGSATIALVVGGTFQDVARDPRLLGCDALIYVDVSAETAKIGKRKGVFTYSLAHGLTISMLMEMTNCPRDLRRELELLPAADLTEGLGQVRAVGAMAVEVLLRDSRFGRMLRDDVLRLLMKKHDCVITDVSLMVFASNAGGVGGSTALPITKRICETILENFACTVHCTLVRAGSLTYEGVAGDRVHLNGAATLAEDLEWLQSSQRAAREVRSGYFMEFPLVDTDARLRSMYVRQTVQAVYSAEMADRTATTSPNAHLRGRLGGVTLLQCRYFRPLADADVAAETARAYRHDLQSFDAPSIAGNDVEVALGFHGGSFTVPAAVAKLRKDTTTLSVEPAELEALSAQVAYHGRPFGDVRFADGMVLGLHAARTFPARPQESVAEYQEHFARAAAVEHGLKRTLENRRADVTAAERTHVECESEFRRHCARRFPRNAWQSMVNWAKDLIADPGEVQAAFRASMDRVYASACATAKLKTEARILQEVLAEFHGELTAAQGVLKETAAMLVRHDAVAVNRHRRLIRPAALDLVLQDVLKAVRDGNQADVGRLLAMQAAEVTLAGLAQITGAAEPRAAAIAEKLVDPPRSVTAAPPWGADSGFSIRQIAIVLPCVSDENINEIRIHVRQRDDGVAVLRCDAASAGANVLQIVQYQPHSIDDVISRFIGRYLEEARRQPALYFPNGMQCLDAIGYEPPVASTAAPSSFGS